MIVFRLNRVTLKYSRMLDIKLLVRRKIYNIAYFLTGLKNKLKFNF